MRQWCREVVPTVDNNLAQSLMRLLDCFLEPFREVEGTAPPNPKVCLFVTGTKDKEVNLRSDHQSRMEHRGM